MARRYIELDNFISTVKATPRCDLATALMIANNYSTAEVEEVRHGKWLQDFDEDYYCSACGSYPKKDVDNYCPNCGAIMDGTHEKHTGGKAE